MKAFVFEQSSDGGFVWTHTVHGIKGILLLNNLMTLELDQDKREYDLRVYRVIVEEERQ